MEFLHPEYLYLLLLLIRYRVVRDSLVESAGLVQAGLHRGIQRGEAGCTVYARHLPFLLRTIAIA